jgi:hypothetical protein
VLELLSSLSAAGSASEGGDSGLMMGGTPDDAEAVELLWEECGIPEGQHLTRAGWERFMLQVGGLGEGIVLLGVP